MRRSKFFILSFIFMLALAVPGAVFAADTLGIQTVGETTVLGDQGLIVTVNRIINVFLGLLGIIAVGIVLYGGYVYMTAGGDEERVSTAKRIIVNGVIGLAIILSAYLITRFVIDRLSGATGISEAQTPASCSDLAYAAENPERCSPSGFDCEADGTCCTAESFVVRSITPARDGAPGTPTGMNNAILRVIFSQPISADIPAGRVFSIDRGGDVSGEFAFAYTDDTRLVVAATPVAGPLLPAGEYTVTVNSDVRDEDGNPITEEIACGFFDTQASFTIDTTGVTDSIDPVIASLTINGDAGEDVPLARNNTYPLQASLTDDHGIGFVQVRIEREDGTGRTTLYDGPPIIRGSAAPVENPYTYDYTLTLPANAPLLARYIVRLTAHDIDNNETVRETSFVVLGDHCANGVQDGDETDVDFGGSCIGNGACTADWQCASENCDETTGLCVASPIILDVSPWDGAGGNWITVEGRYFGNDPGAAAFGYDRNDNGAIEETEWIPASLAQCGGDGSWHDSYVVIEVPVNDTVLPPSSRSAIRISRGDDATLFDTTVNDVGPIAGPENGYFVKNTIDRPGLCRVIPNAGRAETGITLIGRGFTNSATGNDVLFGGIEAPVDVWGEENVETRVPRNLRSGRVGVTVRVGTDVSNGIPFTVLSEDEDTIPVIDDIDPNTTTRESYVTIHGRGFGAAVGRVYLTRTPGVICTDENEACVRVNPVSNELCSASWTDTQIVIAIPVEGIESATYIVFVETAAGRQSNGAAQVTVVDGGPLPSLCSITPAAGPSPLPEGQTIALSGDHFSNTATIFFWTVGSIADDFSTWLSSPAGTPERLGDRETVRTALPVSVDGYSMQTGPIRLRTADGRVSNSVNYTVSDCRAPGVDSIPGYQCCSATGLWRDDAFLCPGETREAGYAYRFTTGRIPRVPQVVESCSEDGAFFPSPTPWERWGDGENVCVNATVAVRFSMDMRETTLAAENVRVFTCGTGDEPDCAEAIDVSDELEIIPASPVMYIRQVPPRENLAPNTWYRVALLEGIESEESVTVLGVPQTVYQPLIATRSCGEIDDRETAYCFEFKTGTSGNECVLRDVGIQPETHTARLLGPLLDPRSSAANPRPFYYYLWGEGSQACTVMNVDDNNWVWSTDGPAASVDIAPLSPQYTDTRATGEAQTATPPEGVQIQATATIDTQTYTGTSQLFVVPEDPRVVEFWPDCQEACTNASIGVRFNRHMLVDDYDGAITVYPCADQTCYPGGVAGHPDALPAIGIRTIREHPLLLEVEPLQSLAANTWYQVEVQEIRAVDGYVRQGDEMVPVPGPILPLVTRQFHTKDGDGFCSVDRTEVEPDPFTAYRIGEKTTYAATPFGSPDECSAVGQRLSAWDFGWNWETGDDQVATVSQFEYAGDTKPYCGLDCLVLGADIPRDAEDSVGVCGNGTIDPGEDCDIAGDTPAGDPETPGTSCSLACLRPGSDTAFCGNGQVDYERGEECDTNDPATQAFCGSNCVKTGAGDAAEGVSFGFSLPVCGAGGVTFGEDCESGVDGETARTCSRSCLHTGTALSQAWCDSSARERDVDACETAVSICGNGIVEADEECDVDAAGDVWVTRPDGSAMASVRTGLAPEQCNQRCLLENICGSTDAIPLYCEPGEPGCTANCTLRGASIGYTASSLCGDGVVGTGEFAWCEYAPEEISSPVIGQNPVQAVTAVGESAVDPLTLAQTTLVRATAVAQRSSSEEAEIQPLENPSVGDGTYALQCGYTEFTTPQVRGGETVYNDCPEATDGVGTNSCCAPRPARIDSYPEDGAGVPGGPSGSVCRNTFISVTFDGDINEATLANNVILAEGHEGTEFDCAQNGETDVSPAILPTLARGSGASGTRGFLATLWLNVRNFFGGLFGTEAEASLFSDINIGVWCSGRVRVTPEVEKARAADGTVVATTVALPISDLLNPNTTYAVFLEGGVTGIKDVRGIGIRRGDPGAEGLNDSILFRTGNDVCKLSSVSVAPAAYVYATPNTAATFTAEAISAEGQMITSIPEVYAWEWSWGPQGNELFTIPDEDDESVEILSENSEGTLLASVNATVVADQDQSNNQTGEVFSDFTELTALFCENPWPARAYYPYEDAEGNRDDYTDGFTGNDQPAVVIGNSRVYFNFSTGYCADGNLPYLRPLLQGNLEDVSVSTVVNPEHLSSVASGRHGRLPLLNSPQSVTFHRGYAVVVGGENSENGGLQVIDVSNPRVPRVGQGVIHHDTSVDSSTGLSEPELISPYRIVTATQANRRTYAFVSVLEADTEGGAEAEIFPAISVFDISEPSSVVFVSSHRSTFLPDGVGEFYRPTALAASPDGTRLYVYMRHLLERRTSDYPEDALAIFDTSNPENIVPITVLTDRMVDDRPDLPADTYISRAQELVLSGDRLYLASNNNDFVSVFSVENDQIDYLFQLEDNRNPNLDGAMGLSVSPDGGELFVASRSGWLSVYDISDPDQMREISRFEHASLTDSADIALSGDVAVVVTGAGGTGSVVLIDIADMARPEYLGELRHGTDGALLNNPESLTVYDSVAYIASEDSNALEIVDVSLAEAALETLPTVSGALKQFLFFNDQNDDIIGLQVFDNTTDGRFSAREWYERRFGPVPSQFRDVTVDGYDAITDGNTYYVNALNLGASREIFNNLIVLSVNPDAQAGTRQVFETLVQSLQFNVNVTNFGYCSVGDGTAAVTDVDTPDADASIACTTDFDCLDVNGTARICANAKTKLQRDWERLQDLRAAQENLANYELQGGQYPSLRSGTFIPGYTASRWPSWGRLGALIGAIPTDPVNIWDGCGTNDPQTCWDPVQSQFLCPNQAQVYEYWSENGSDYALYAPFEYMSFGNDIVRDFVDLDHFSAGRWCTPASLHSPFAETCGDGIINVNRGEECEVGQVDTAVSCAAGERGSRTCTASCVWGVPVCEDTCGNGRVDFGESCDDGTLNGQYGHCNADCSGSSADYCGDGRLNAPQEFCEITDNRYDETGFCLKQSCRAGARYEFTNQTPTLDFFPRISAVHALNTTTAWAIGVSESTGIFAPSESAILRYDATRREWAMQFQPPFPDDDDYNTELLDIFFLDSQRGWAVGSRGFGFAVIYRTTNGGTTWTQWPVLAGSGEEAMLFPGLHAVSFADRNTGWVVGEYSGLGRTTDGGQNWTFSEIYGNRERTTFYDVHFVDNLTGWIVGTEGGRGFIIHTEDGGLTWDEQLSDSTRSMRGVHFVNTSFGWAVGDNDAVFRTTNGGNTWIPAPTGNTAVDFLGASFLDQNVGFISGGGGEVFSTMNGGIQWTRQTDVGTTGSRYFTDIAGVSAVTAWVADSFSAGGLYRMDVNAYCTSDRASTNHITDCDANADCQYGDACRAVTEVDYHARSQNACAMDCQSAGGFCGDGIVQPVYEECDDGNGDNTDACTNYCLTPVAGASASLVRTGTCGDGIVQAGEACDTGSDNGIACDPAYGRSCTYCSQFCTQVLTRSATTFCGNGVVDATGVNTRGQTLYEVCDTDPVSGTVVSTTQSLATVCPDEGSYSCVNSCTQLLNNCVSCGEKPLDRGGASPRIAALNVMTGDTIASEWGEGTHVNIYDTDGETLVPGVVASILGPLPTGLPMRDGYRPLSALYTQPQALFGAFGLETNRLCADNYRLHFDRQSNPYGYESGFLATSFIDDRILGDLFPFPVIGELGVVDNEYVVSSPLQPEPAGWANVRIVVRWTHEENERGAEFTGMLYNEAFSQSGAQSIVNLPRATTDTTIDTDPAGVNAICDTILRQSSPPPSGPEYWSCPSAGTNNYAGGYEGSIHVHPIGRLERTFTQAMTLYAGAGPVSAAPPEINTTYAFFVDALDGSMSRYRNSNLMVEIYGWHEDQDTLYSVWRPIETFEIRHVADSSLTDQDQYWHAFNIVRTTQSDGTDDYQIQRFGGGPNGGHGSIESDFQGVLRNIPGHYVGP